MRTLSNDVIRLDRTSRWLQGCYRAIAGIPFLPSSGSYNLTISNTKKFVWFRVAKAGTRTIYHHFLNHQVPLEVEHVSSIHYAPKLYSGYYKFAFVRNPWDRLVSCWLDKVVANNRFGFKEPQLTRVREFKNFVGYVSSLDLETCDHHLRLQSKLIDITHIDYVGRLESFEPDFNAICERLGVDCQVVKPLNSSASRKPYHDYYDDDLQKKVAALYSRDIQIFGYRF
jgi:hypothetical protein